MKICDGCEEKDLEIANLEANLRSMRRMFLVTEDLLDRMNKMFKGKT